MRTSSRALLALAGLGLTLSACGSQEVADPTPSTSTASPSTSTATSVPTSTAPITPSTSVAPPTTEAPAPSVDPAQSDLDLLKGTDWLNVPIINLAGDAGERAALSATADGGTQYLGTSYNIVNGQARALVVYADRRGYEFPTAVLGLYGVEGGKPVQIAAGDVEDLEGASNAESFYIVHAAFEETPEGVRVYANDQAQGYQTSYVSYRVRMIEGGGEMYGFNGDDGTPINWLNAGPTADVLTGGATLDGLPPKENVITFSPYASNIAQPLPAIDAEPGTWE